MDTEIKRLERHLLIDPTNIIVIRQLAALYQRIGWTFNGMTIGEWIEEVQSNSEVLRLSARLAFSKIGPVRFLLSQKLSKMLGGLGRFTSRKHWDTSAKRLSQH